MIKIIKELKIEVSKPNIFQAVVAKQYDMNTRFIKATLVDGSDVIEIPKRTDDSIKVVINAERPDGAKDSFEGEVNGDDTVTVPLHSWMLEIEGTVICDISIIDLKDDSNKKLTTTSFTLMVEKAAYGGTDITSDPQFDVLVSLMEAATVAQKALDKSNEALKLVSDCEEATENANAVREEIEAGGYIESLKEMNTGGKFSFWVGTQAEYDALSDKVDNCFYLITDGTDAEDFEKLKTDYIVEQGTVKVEGMLWTYRKWASGIAECWGRTGLMRLWTGLEWYGETYCEVTLNLPFINNNPLFIDEPDPEKHNPNMVNILSGGGGLHSCSLVEASNQSVMWRVTNHKHETENIDVFCTIEVKGRWKPEV